MAPRYMVSRKMADSEYKSSYIPDVSIHINQVSIICTLILAINAWKANYSQLIFANEQLWIKLYDNINFCEQENLNFD